MSQGYTTATSGTAVERGPWGTGGSLTEKLPMAVVEGCSEGRVQVGVLSAAVTVAAVNPQFCGEGRTEPLVPGSAVL